MPNNKMTGVSSYREIVRKALPVIISVFLTTIIPVIDNFMAGKIGDGKSAIAGMAYAGSILFVFRISLMGLSGGATVMLGQFAGAKDWGHVRDANRLKLANGLILWIPFLLACTIWPDKLIGLFTDDANQIAEGSTYIKWMTIAMVTGPVLAQYASSGAQLGYTSIFLYLSIAQIVGNATLDYISIRFTDFGVKGLAWATIVVQFLGFVFIYAYHWKKHTHIHTNLFKIFSIHKVVIVKSLKRWHMFLTEVIFTGTSMAVAAIMSYAYKDNHVSYGAVQGITAPITRITISGFLALTSTVGYFVGTRLGESDFKSAAINARRLLITAQIFAIALSGILAICAQWVVMIFTKTPQPELDAAAMYFRFFPLIAIQLSFSALGLRILETGGMTKPVMIADAIYCIVFWLGLTLLLAHVWHPESVWLALFLVNSIRWIKAIYVAVLLLSKKWLKNLTLKDEVKIKKQGIRNAFKK